MKEYMMQRIKFNRLLISIFAIALTTLNACSYAVDMVERAITKRASFSIEAVYNGDGTVTLRWDKTGGNNFAGFEIYMTIEPDNEYAGYAVVGAAYPISTSNLFKQDNNLQFSTCSYFTTNNVKTIMGVGRYFFRVGIIEWDEDEDKRTEENGYVVPWYDHIFENYIINTNLDEISGTAMVDVF